MIVGMMIDGVLSDVELPNATVNPDALRLYHALADGGVAFYLFSTSLNEAMVRDWLLREGFTRWAKLITMEQSIIDEPNDWKVYTFQEFLGANIRPTLYIDWNVEAVRAISDLGFPTMLWVPANETPAGRDDYTPWNILTETIDTRRLKTAEKQRRINQYADQ